MLLLRAVAAAAMLVTGAAVPVRAAGPVLPSVPRPTVEGPITGGLKGHPFNAAPFDLRAHGYVEEEYFFGGTATAYDASPIGLAPAGPDATPPPPARYRTRMIIRRPANPARFNGTVVLEWLNVTSGYDFEATWVEVRREVLRRGYAYVGVTAQLAGSTALKAVDPIRYGALTHPGDQYSYDMFSQAARALRAPLGARAMGPLRVRTTLAVGESQSGTTLTTYINNVFPKVQPVIDGFAPDTATERMPDIHVPVLRIVTEFEAAGSSQADSRFYRHWEVAGASHADKQGGEYVVQTQNRDFGMPPGVNWPLAPADVPGCSIGRFPRYLANHAALDALNRWVTRGVAPPKAPRMALTREGAIARDRHGNAIGGLRLPAIDVPTATYRGERQNECAFTLGRTDPFDAAKLRSLYPSQARYAALVDAATTRAVRAGFLLREDGAELRAAAARAAIGTPTP